MRSGLLRSLRAAAVTPLLGLAALACGGRSSATDTAARPAPKPTRNAAVQLGPVATGAPRPLALFATRAIAVYPVQRLSPGDTLGWSARIADVNALLASLDDEIRFAFEGRKGLGTWHFVPALERAARRAVPYRPSIRDLPVEPLMGVLSEDVRSIPAGLAESVRMIGGLVDVRWALVPVQLSFAPAEGGQRAVLRIALIDVRLGEVAFAGDVLGESTGTWSGTVLASVAQRVADQFVAP